MTRQALEAFKYRVGNQKVNGWLDRLPCPIKVFGAAAGMAQQ